MELEIFGVTNKRVYIPLFQKIEAGFPSPADGYEEERLDINDLVVTHPDATFFVRVKGESMINANINDGDILVVDRSLNPKHNDIVIAAVDGSFTVKTLFKKDSVTKLVPANPTYPEIVLKGDSELNIWGVVSYVIHKARA